MAVTCPEDQGEVPNVLDVDIRAFFGPIENQVLHQRQRLALAAHRRWSGADDNPHQGPVQ